MSLFKLKIIKNKADCQKEESGSAIIWVLIMIALFAALSYTVAKSTRSNTSTMDEQQAALAATEILSYSRNVKDAVHRLQISSCSDTEISFENNTVAGYTNPNAPTDKSCHVFDMNGGGLRYTAPNSDWLDNTYSSYSYYNETYFPDAGCVKGVGNDSANYVNDGIDNEELLLMTPWLKKDICIKLNENIGMRNVAGNPPRDSGRLWPADKSKFIGNYGDKFTIDSGRDDYAIASGKMNGCLEADPGGSQPNAGYHFYQVLIAR